jgi:hypothetical protein
MNRETRQKAASDPVLWLAQMGHASLDGLPESLRAGYAQWYLYGLDPSLFLRAVIENKLLESFGTATQYNAVLLPEIVDWFQHYADYRAIGKNAKSWGDNGGWFGRQEDQSGEM